MAVAPLPNVRAVLDYAVTEIPPEKIFLGVPNYGYDWPLPFIQGTTRAQSISNQRAIELAIAHDVAIQYDSTAQSPFFHYTAKDGTVHEVWFEDARQPFRQAAADCGIRLSGRRILESHAALFPNLAGGGFPVRYPIKPPGQSGQRDRPRAVPLLKVR